MSLLLDTHVLIWLAEGLDALSPSTRRVLEDGARAAPLRVSAISFWETAMLEARGRISLTRPVPDWRRQVLVHGAFVEQPIAGDVAIEAVHLPGSLHDDPADRLLIATARLGGFTMVTRDRRILDYGRQGHLDVLAV